MSSIASAVKYLYKASHPISRIKVEPDHIGIGPTCLVETLEELNSLLFAVDVEQLSFGVAVALCAKGYAHREKLPMYRQYFEQCHTKFRKHHQWHDMQFFSIPIN